MSKIFSFISKIIKDLKVVLILLPSCWSSVFAIFLMWYLLWFNNQGQDILVELSSESFFTSVNAMLYFFSILILALFNWFLPKKTFGKRYEKIKAEIHQELDPYPEDDIDKIKVFIPRYLAYLTIIIAGYSITHTGELQMYYGLRDSMFLGMSNGMVSIITSFVAAALPIIFFTKLPNLFKAIVPKKSVGTILLIVSSILFLSFLPPIVELFTGSYSNLYFASFLLSPLMFAMFLYGLFVVRTRLSTRDLEEGGTLYRFVNFIKDDRPESQFINVITYAACFSVVAHIIFNSNPKWSIHIGPGPVFVIAIMAFVVIINSIILSLIKVKNENKSAFILLGTIGIIILIFSCNQKKFHVHSLDGDIPERISATDYADKWLKNYAATRDSTIYLVASYGGGIRATYWTNLVLARYMDATQGKFFSQTFGLSGSSGGMVGQGVFISLGEEPGPSVAADSLQFMAEVEQLYDHKNKDYLSPIISRLLGFDLIKSIIPIPGPDRHRSLERLFEDRLAGIGKGSVFKGDFLDYWYPGAPRPDSINLPILVCNSTYSQKGIRATYSPVVLTGANSAHSLDLFDELTRIDSDDYGSVPFSTAVLQSARFPYASPPGTFPNGMQFVDAGYYDNMGGSGTIDLLQLLARSLDCSQYKDRFKINVIIINSSPRKIIENDSVVGAYAGILNPLSSHMNTGTGHTKAIEDALIDYCSYLKIDKRIDISVISSTLRPTSDYQIQIDGDTTDLKYIFPLGWYLSQQSLTGMKDQAKLLDIWNTDALQSDDFDFSVSELEIKHGVSGCIITEISDCDRYANIDVGDCSEIDSMETYEAFTTRIVEEFGGLASTNASTEVILKKAGEFKDEINKMKISENQQKQLIDYVKFTGYITDLQGETKGIEINEKQKISYEVIAIPSTYSTTATNRDQQQIQRMDTQTVEKSKTYEKLEKINTRKVRVNKGG